MKIRAEARCPESYYEEIMKKDFKSWSKMQLVAFINMNSDEDNQVTMRPRKSTLVKRAENMQLMADAKKICKVEPKINSLMKHLTLIMCGAFFIMLGLEVVNFYTLDLPFGEFIGVIGVFLLILGIPLWVIWMEFKRRG